MTQMTDDLNEYRKLLFMPSRIPALDALETFVPTGAERDAEMEGLIGRTGFARWYPVEGGHLMRTLYEGGDYNAERFTLLKGGWDHEHCTRCRENIAPMTLCWVTRSGRYVILDEECHREIFGDSSAQ